MKKPDSTSEFLETLTPREARVLRQRFGLDTDVHNIDGELPPPHGSNSNNSGGAPATPLPPIPDIKTQ